MDDAIVPPASLGGGEAHGSQAGPGFCVATGAQPCGDSASAQLPVHQDPVCPAARTRKDGETDPGKQSSLTFTLQGQHFSSSVFPAHAVAWHMVNTQHLLNEGTTRP